MNQAVSSDPTTPMSFDDGQVRKRPGTWLRALPLAVFIVDGLLMACAIFIAVQTRGELALFGRNAEVTSTVGIVAASMLFAWLLAITLIGGYEPEVFDVGVEEYKRVLRGTLGAAAMVGIACYLVKYDLSRGFFVLAFGVGTVLLLLGRFALRRVMFAARRRGHLVHRVLIAGSPLHADQLAANLTRQRRLGYQLLGVVTPHHDPAATTLAGHEVLGHMDDLAALTIESGCDVLFITGGAFDAPSKAKELAWALEQHPIQLIVAPSLTDVSGERIRFRPIDGLPLIHVEGPRGHLATRGGKRAFDIVLSTLAIVLLSPVLILAALRIRAFDRGPVLFSQTRIGKDSTPFQCLKFRTMVVNAESLVEKLQKEQGAGALLFKMKDDPRITKPGKWMRRFSVDELPQLFNVLRGDMSLVGPRPQVQREVDSYEGPMSRRLRVRPGMTGLWQVSGRSDLSQAEAMRLDLYYVDNWSMVQDLSILSRTVGAVFGSSGAY